MRKRPRTGWRRGEKTLFSQLRQTASRLAAIALSGEPREGVASGKGMVVASLSRGPGVLRRRSGLLQAWQGFAAQSAGAYACPKTAFRAFGPCAAILLAWRTQADPARPGEGGSPARRSPAARSRNAGRGDRSPRRSTPLPPLPYVSAESESASSRPHRHVTRSVRRRKEVQDRGGFRGGENMSGICMGPPPASSPITRLQSSKRCLHRTQRSRRVGGAPPSKGPLRSIDE